MTKHINPFKILTLAAFIALPALSHAAGNDDGAEKKKTISKSYTVTASDKLKIENSFGEVVINTWDKNEFKIDIEMYAKAETDESAQYMLDHIKIEESQSDNVVRFKTDIHINVNNHNGDDNNDDGDDDKDDKKKRKYNREDHEFHINYTVYMPAINPLEINNQFGKTIVPDFKGPVSITSGFGSLTAGKLDNVEKIDVQFGKADIGQVNNGKLNFQYDDKVYIANLSGTVKLVNAFSGGTQVVVNNNIEDLSINDSYSTIRLVVSKELSASFTIHTNFGDFHNSTDFSIPEAKEDDDNGGPKFDKDFSGKAVLVM